ncbi:MAG: VWA domain-containing protein [Haloplanus sp.]
MDHSISSTLEKAQLPDSGGEMTVELDVDPASTTSESLPIHIVFCVDSSSSMSGSPIRAVKNGVPTAASELSSEDKVGVVEFADDGHVVTDPVAGHRTDALEDAVERIDASGNTNIMDGLAKSRGLLEDMAGGGFLSDGETAIEWIVLLTDGAPNRTNYSAFRSIVERASGMSKADQHGKLAEELGEAGITVHTAGVGQSYNVDVVEAISDGSGGEWAHVTSERNIGSFFRERVQNARDVVATDPHLNLYPKRGTTIADIRQQAPQIAEPATTDHGDHYEVDVPDLNPNKPPRFSFHVDVPEQDSGRHTVVVAELETDAGAVTTEVAPKFVPAALRSDDPNITVTERHEEAGGYMQRKESMDPAEREGESKKLRRE